MPFDFLSGMQERRNKMTQKIYRGGYGSPKTVNWTANENYITVK